MLSIQEFVRLTTSSQDDVLFAQQQQHQDFSFNQEVVSVFPDMIGRSVPGYWDGAEWIGMLSRRFATTDCTIYDLGCSLGAVSWGIYRNWGAQCPKIIAVDNSQPMISHFQQNLAALNASPPFELHCANILEHPISNAAMIVMNFTLQFIAPKDRLTVLKRVYDGLKPGGVLILSEKTYGETPDAEKRLRDWHHDFKRYQGYSDLEIQQKSDAISNIMPLDTPQQQSARLREAGFSSITTWMQCFNFSSLIAEKPA